MADDGNGGRESQRGRVTRLWTYNFLPELAHHGIKGMKWGVRNGPPYPLKDDVKSNSEKRLARGKKSGYNLGENKDVIRTKSGEIIRKLAKAESLDETVRRANPLRKTKSGSYNCVFSAIAGFMRQAGYDVTAKACSKQGRQLLSDVENFFDGADTYYGTAIEFGRSKSAAAKMLVRKYGKNAAGVCSIKWRGEEDGHSFNWQIKNGIVEFFDCQNGLMGKSVDGYFNGAIDKNGWLELARLDNAKIVLDKVVKAVKGK